MFEDHHNLLSTFGKDSQSSERKSKTINCGNKMKKLPFIDAIQPKTRYEKILHQRKITNYNEKKQPTFFKDKQRKNDSQKIRTQSEIQCLNTRIRKSISGIAQSICKSKIKSNGNSKVSQTQINSLRKNNQNSSRLPLETYKDSKKYNSKKRQQQNLKIASNNKENFDINAFELNKKGSLQYLNRNQYLKNSTKKKNYCLQQQNNYPIKSSFSIDLNSHASSRFQSSRKNTNSKRKTQEQVERIFAANFQKIDYNNQRKNSKNKYKIDSQFLLNKQMQETLKKQNKKYNQKYYKKDNQFQSTKNTAKNQYNQQFLFYQDIKEIQKNKYKISIQKRQKLYTEPSRQKNELKKKKAEYHPLIQAFVMQIQYDYNLRHAKHLFSGIQEPFNVFYSNEISQSKWTKLNQQLRKIGVNYSIQKIKKLFLPCQQQIDPFLSVNKGHEQLIYSLIYSYQQAQIYWQQNIYQKWQHWDLRDIDLTIENIDRNRKGYISVQDLAAFLALQTGIQYKNRDLILIYKRFLSLNQNNMKVYDLQEDECILRFRCLIDSLIKPFTHKKIHQEKY